LLPFPSSAAGFHVFENLGGIKAIQAHVHALTQWTYAELAGLQHSNGAPILQIFGKHTTPNNASVQGGILNFEVLRPDGSLHSYKVRKAEGCGDCVWM
jgi:molybdenum cofactor sulfurtransferase